MTNYGYKFIFVWGRREFVGIEIVFRYVIRQFQQRITVDSKKRASILVGSFKERVTM